MIKGIIFDLDGVLLSTDIYHYQSWKALADKEGILFSKEDNDRLRGVSRLESLNALLRKAGRVCSDAEKERMCDEKNRLYRRFLAKMDASSVDPRIRQCLMTLRKEGYRLAIGSGSKNTQYILDRVELTPYFDAIADGTMIAHSKPDPEVFLLAAKKLGLSPSECVVVEDAFAGIEAAKNGGFLAVAVGDARKDPRKDASLDGAYLLPAWLRARKREHK